MWPYHYAASYYYSTNLRSLIPAADTIARCSPCVTSKMPADISEPRDTPCPVPMCILRNVTLRVACAGRSS